MERIISLILILLAVIGTGFQAYRDHSPGWAGLCFYLFYVLLSLFGA